MFCSTATTVAILQNAWSGHSPDTPVTYSRLWGVGKNGKKLREISMMIMRLGMWMITYGSFSVL
ncbi:hypothetical protein, partial [Klebsiella pneumoniae]|uniref:hypothetical protein n=1 Tax=Klebsiella pneumoniae TaxID=573 RepID=UPI003853279D